MIKALEDKFNKTTTDNGAVAYKSTKSYLLDLFFKLGTLDYADEETQRQFRLAIEEDSLLATKLLFFTRDIRQGLGRRQVFRDLIKYLIDKDVELVRRNLDNIAFYGRYDDLIELLNVTSLYDKDIKKIILRDIEGTLLAKWLPSINTSSHKTKKLGRRVASLLGLSEKKYRQLLSKHRANLNLVETKLCNKDYDIDYSKLPSLAQFKYRQAFSRNDYDRYWEFLNSKTKINSSTLYPYQIVGKILNEDITDEEKLLFDKQWSNMPKIPMNALAVVDVSGSMYDRPIEVAISLGIMIAEAQERFHNKFITFSSEPELVEVKGKDIYDKVTNVSQANWSMSTNIYKVFRLILDSAIENNLTKEEMIDELVIISDMQFNVCCKADRTVYEKIRKDFNKAGYDVPNIIFWNVSANSSIPVTKDEDGTILVSGFSQNLFSNIANIRDYNPYNFMLETLNSERYEQIK